MLDVLLDHGPDAHGGRLDVDGLVDLAHPAMIPRVPEVVPRRMLGALRHRNYRLFLTGQIVSTIGTWMQSVAMPWRAPQLTHSALLVGLVLAAQFMPVLLGSQFGGVVADRYRKRSVLLVIPSLFTLP